MRVGILTQPLHRNYGGILQNWALQQVLKDMGHEPEMIFLCLGNRPRGKLLVLRCMSFVKCVVKKYLFGHKDVYLYSVFNPQYNPSAPQYADAEFVGRIHKTKRLLGDVDLAKLVSSRGYDAFIVGSDQVWREDYSPSITCFFLDFLPEEDKCPRIAYAASFGKSEDYISPENMPRCRELLHRFDAVSVREYEGLDILKRDFDYHRGVKVLDPTLLLSVDDYRREIKDKDFLDKTQPHVSAYILDASEDKSAILAEVASHLELSVKTFSGEFSEEKMLTVSQWLAEFEGADFVVTDSFHGCVFSIIFHKPFVAIANKNRGLDRFVSLLRDAGLEDRLVYSSYEFMARKDELLIASDYVMVEKRLASLRTMSLDFLINAIKKKNEWLFLKYQS